MWKVENEDFTASILSAGKTDVTVDLELLQEKQDEIERLTDLLEKQKVELADALKNIADIKEDLKIAQERTLNAINEREKFADKNRENIHKIQNLKD